MGRAGADHRASTSTTSSSGSRSASFSAAASAMCCFTICRISPSTRCRSFRLWNGGMSFHGGVLGCMRRRSSCSRCDAAYPILSLGDVTAAVAPIGLFLGRIANFINGELWGRPTDVPWAMIFPERRSGAAPSKPALRSRARRRRAVRRARRCWCAPARSSGRASSPAVFAIGYGVARITCEFFREPDVQLGFLWGGADHGNVAVHSAGARRHRAACFRLCRKPARRNRREKWLSASPLEREIRRLIGIAGPMPIAEYMRHCLTHPQHGYYINRDPFGSGGDFVTSPEISQMFGELIGLWMASVWQQMGAPENVRIVELGPGRGTLMKDAMRAARDREGFPRRRRFASRRNQSGVAEGARAAARRTRHSGVVAQRFRRSAARSEHHHRQRIHRCAARAPSRKQADGWHERVVEIDTDGKLAIWTWRARRCRISRPGCRGRCASLPRTRSLNGVPTPGDRARAARALGGRRFDHRLRSSHVGSRRYFAGGCRTCLRRSVAGPGEADFTAHVDFEAFAQIAESIGAGSTARFSNAIFCSVSASTNARRR